MRLMRQELALLSVAGLELIPRNAVVEQSDMRSSCCSWILRLVETNAGF
jgi:hypothetical protein